MITIADDEYKQICLLYNNGEYIKSLKKHCNLIIKKECSKEILIDYRKKLYSIFVSGINGINDDVIIMFKYAIEKCTLNNEKYNIPFIKKAIAYLEQKNNVDYNLINDWLDYYNLDLLNTEIYGNNKYSDREMYYLKKAKTLDALNKKSDLESLLVLYQNENPKNEDIVFFIKYHICRLLFANGSYEMANDYLQELLVIKREKYVLGLPIKYQDYTNQQQKVLFIIEILINGQTPDYLYAYIINWLKKSDFSNILDKINEDFIFEDNNYKITNYKKIKKDIIRNLCFEKNIKSVIKHGKIINITKSGNAFLSSNNDSFFVNRKYLDNDVKIGTNVNYFVIKVYDYNKKCNMKQAVVISRRYTDEILCGKKGKRSRNI